MSSELRVKLRGPDGAMDASRVAKDLQQFVMMLWQLEVARLGPRRTASVHSLWSVSHLYLNSVEVGFAPLEPRAGADWDDLDAVNADVLKGFEHAELYESLPPGWSPEAARPAQAISSRLGLTESTGLMLTLYADGEARRSVEVTRRASSNLKRALHVRDKSLGSVVGTLQSVSLHRTKVAGLWTDRTGRRVAVKFANDQIGQVRDVLGQRVMIKGELERNPAGQLLAVRFRRLEVLPTADSAQRLASLGGSYPDLTGGMGAVEHVGGIRGTP